MLLADIAFNDDLCVNAKLIFVNCSNGENLYTGSIIASDIPKESFEQIFEGTPHRHEWKQNKYVSEYATNTIVALSVEKNCLFVAIQ